MKQAIVFATFAPLAFLTGVQAKSADGWIATIWDDFKEAVDCGSCQVNFRTEKLSISANAFIENKALLGGLKLVADFGEPFLEEVLTGVCDISGAEDSDVCSGIIANESPAVYYSLKNLKLGSHTAKTFCASLVGLCDFPAVRPYKLPFPSAKPPISRPPPSGKPPIKVVHFSDTHVDLSYETGSNFDCTKPICCRAYTEQDAPGNTSSPCGSWGNSKCDPPHRLQQSMMDAITSLNPSFSIYTGDVVAHDVWLVDKSEALSDFNATFSTIESNLGLVYAALGNHDTAPLNLFPSTNTPSTYNPQWAYDALTTHWLTLTDNNQAISTAKKYGSYSATHKNTKLRIISYNSIFYYKYNFFSYEEPMLFDPDNQLAWLISELSAAEAASERVWLISHIPSGNVDHFRDHSHYFDQIVQRYEATIAGLFFGHTHTDEFQISYSDYEHRSWDNAVAMGYVAPSMTPTSGPPSFRVYEIDPVTFGVLDYTQYIANITGLEGEPEWVPYYSAKKDYGGRLDVSVSGEEELTPAFWHNFTVAMEKDEGLFEKFWARRTRGFEVPACKGDCFWEEGERKDLLGKRFQPECNHAGMAPLLAKIAHRASLAREMEL
ncbi:uncharacterized protein N7477_008154 [Penicillium maclennaniae]|uniref:uncharacterized protein n=1 Tax=Penicillium maclennaniae TaxID=1343394 RepID=UPI00253F8D25|nr:uncharacterized protein N7477_008154 [Penicillium maclennaniae]KAJ5665706.1 hypothetical protein N7477_008154 [Penicillium maclennaniae]